MKPVLICFLVLAAMANEAAEDGKSEDIQTISIDSQNNEDGNTRLKTIDKGVENDTVTLVKVTRRLNKDEVTPSSTRDEHNPPQKGEFIS